MISTRPRRQNGRSRRGCATCRLRRVRCDEQFQFSHINETPSIRPSCLNCQRTDRQCEGPPDFVLSDFQLKKTGAVNVVVAIGRSPTRSASPPDEGELRAFEFYIRSAATSIAQGMDIDFWTQVLPQVSEQDPSIRHAILAISALYEHPLEAERDHYQSPEQMRAVSWYRQSVKNAMSPSVPETADEGRRLEHSILTCMLYAIVETQYCNASNALRLILQGLKLVLRYLNRYRHGHSAHSPWMVDVLPMFARQVMNLGIFRGEVSPEYDELLQSLLPPFANSLPTLSTARDSLYAILHEAIPIAVSIAASGVAKGMCDENLVPLLEQQHATILAKLDAWELAVRLLDEKTFVLRSHKALYHALICLQKMNYMWIYWILCPPYDLAQQDSRTVAELLDEAEAALQHTSSAKADRQSVAPVGMELGVIPPLCFVLWSCRQDDIISQRAITLLHLAASSENMYVARLQADVVARLLGFEAGLATGSGSKTFVDEVLMHSYSFERVVDDAIKGVRRTKKWSWETWEMDPVGTLTTFECASPA